MTTRELEAAVEDLEERARQFTPMSATWDRHAAVIQLRLTLELLKATENSGRFE